MTLRKKGGMGIVSGHGSAHQGWCRDVVNLDTTNSCILENGQKWKLLFLLGFRVRSLVENWEMG